MLTEDYYQLLEMTPEVRIAYANKNPQVFEAVLAAVGHEEAQVRDQLNYRLFIQLLSEDAFSQTIVGEYVQRLSSIEGLLFNIEENETNAVFTRSFSSIGISDALDWQQG